MDGNDAQASTPDLKDDLLEGVKAACGYGGWKERQVYRWVETGQIPHFRVGTKLFFRKSELQAAFRSVAA
jgi:excisionase family DNA binding protein